jgi:uncharacterized protein YndB with AHSA1/START domain
VTTDVLEREIHIAARPETVFEFFTDADLLRRWKGLRATLDPRPGGVYQVDINGRDVVRGEFVEVNPPRRLVFTWGWAGDGSPLPPGASTVEVTLTPEAGGTRVRLRHHGLPSPALLHLHGQGWDHYLPRLQTAAEGRDLGPDPRATPDARHL